MKKLIAWFNKRSAVETEAPANVPPTAHEPVRAKSPILEIVKPQPGPIARAQPVPTPTPFPRPQQKPLPQAPASVDIDLSKLYTGGPELKTQQRGPHLYAVCPHCKAMFGLRERLQRYKVSTLIESKGLTCPSCEQAVAIPKTLNLKKLS